MSVFIEYSKLDDMFGHLLGESSLNGLQKDLLEHGAKVLREGPHRSVHLRALGRRQLEDVAKRFENRDVKTQDVAIQEDHEIIEARYRFHLLVERGSKDSFAEKMVIDVPMATVMLGLNPANRKLTRPNVDRISADSINGDWALNGETIIISKEGLLNDGQNRLTAVVETGTPIQTFVVFGVERDTRHTVDQGTARSPAHVISMKTGLKDSNNLAATATHWLVYKKLGALTNNQLGGPGMSERPSRPAVINCVENDPILVECVRRTGQHKFTPKSLVAFCRRAIIAAGVHMDDTTTFFNKLHSGEMIAKNNPIFVARRLLEAGKKQGGVRLSPNQQAEIIIKAWNAYVGGETVSTFMTSKGVFKLPSIKKIIKRVR